MSLLFVLQICMLAFLLFCLTFVCWLYLSFAFFMLFVQCAFPNVLSMLLIRSVVIRTCLSLVFMFANFPLSYLLFNVDRNWSSNSSVERSLVFWKESMPIWRMILKCFVWSFGGFVFLAPTYVGKATQKTFP